MLKLRMNVPGGFGSAQEARDFAALRRVPSTAEFDQCRGVNLCRCVYRYEGCIASVHVLMSLQTQGFPEIQQLPPISSQELAQFKQPPA